MYAAVKDAIDEDSKSPTDEYLEIEHLRADKGT